MGEHDGHRERLRKYFLRYGMDAMRDHEVLELLLFYALPRKNTNDIARKLLDHFRSISAIMDAPIEELVRVGGIGENSAVLLKLITPLSRRYMQSKTEKGVILSSTKEAGRYVLPYFFGETEEAVYMLCLDAKNKLITCRLLHRGSVNNVHLPIRKAAEIAMTCKATSVILAHNHPSGIPLPSDEDYQATLSLKQALHPLEITLADHFIISDNDYVSMMENGFFPFT